MNTFTITYCISIDADNKKDAEKLAYGLIKNADYPLRFAIPEVEIEENDTQEEDIYAPISRYCFMCDCWTYTTPITSECVDCGHKKD